MHAGTFNGGREIVTRRSRQRPAQGDRVVDEAGGSSCFMPGSQVSSGMSWPAGQGLHAAKRRPPAGTHSKRPGAQVAEVSGGRFKFRENLFGFFFFRCCSRRLGTKRTGRLDGSIDPFGLSCTV